MTPCDYIRLIALLTLCIGGPACAQHDAESEKKSEAQDVAEEKTSKPPQTAKTEPPTKAAKKREKQYKRVHQDALRKILKAQLEKAEQSLREFQTVRDDSETEFLLTLLASTRGDADAAAGHLRRSLELGLPPGRALAGPRRLLEALHDHGAYQQLFKDHLSAPIHGPMVGNVTPTGADVWVRTADEAQVRIWTGRAPEFVDQVSFTAKSSAANDYTAVVRLRGLEPATRYHYVVEVNPTAADAPAASSIVARQHLRTAPTPASQARFRIAFGGGAGFVPENERVWTTIDAFEPTLLLLLGDNIYSDDPESPEMQKYCYYRRQSRPEFRELVAHTPTYSIWDDHDFGTNDCWGGPEIDKPAWKRPVWDVFRTNWANPGYGGGVEQPGCWYEFSYADVQFFLLDGRYYRTDPKVDHPSMLGPAQKLWLKEALKTSTATFKVLCSPVPWEFRTKGNSKDTWLGFEEEREEIFSFVEEHRIEGVVLVSADRHRSDAWRIARANSYDFFEFNSSRLTNQHVHKTMREAIFSYNAKQSFGIVDFDTEKDVPQVTYRVVTIDGEVVHELTVLRSQLTF